MKTSHRFVVTVAIVAVILISVFAAPTVARTTLAEAQARAAGTGGGTVPRTMEATPRPLWPTIRT